MALDTWITLGDDGELMLVTEKDGSAYLREEPGKHWQHVESITLEQVATRFGTDSPKYKRAVALFTAEG